jgi:3-hydroxyacyl-[acyl-carrier-protein] dehydratase
MSAMEIDEILQYLPHRYPFLLVDRVLEIEAGKRIVAVKNISVNEPFFNGHFPGMPVMPGVLMIEAMAQAAGILSFKTLNRRFDGSIMYYLAGVDNARFKRPVVPGDQLLMEVAISRVARNLWKYAGRGTVAGQLAVEADLLCAQRDLGTPNAVNA